MILGLISGWRSADGKLLAYASSDLSIGILDARTLTVRASPSPFQTFQYHFQLTLYIAFVGIEKPLLKILHAHSFPTTALAFNPSGTLLASSSADNTVRLVVVPESFGSCEFRI
jgi:prolactin regulatory element-binding protein